MRIKDQKNTWGSEAGPEPQRSDLWQLDLDSVVKGINNELATQEPMTEDEIPHLPTISRFYPQSVVLPALTVRSDVIRRDSRPYQTPSWDEPLEAIRMTFIVDAARGRNTANPYRSEIYTLLNTWRAIVRAGRGSCSSEPAINIGPTRDLSFEFKADHAVTCAYDLSLSLLKGSSPTDLSLSAADTAALLNVGQPPSGQITTDQATALAFIEHPEIIMDNDLEYSTRFTLVKTWLSSFQLNELSYDAAKVLLITAQFYAEDIQLVRHDANA